MRGTGRARRTAIGRAASVALLATLGSAAPAGAADFTVTNLNDSGAGSLRQALTDAEAAGNDRVLFAEGLAGRIALSSGELDVGEGTEIVGPGADRITVDGGGVFRVFHVGGLPTQPVTISGLTIERGLAGGGGGGVAAAGPITLSGLVFRDNQTAGAGAAVNNGGGPNSGSTTIRDSTFVGNAAAGAGGGAISVTNDALAIERSTFFGNTAPTGSGGAIFHTTGGVHLLSITDSTIAGNNAAVAGGGVQFMTNGRIINSIIAGNTAPARPDVDVIDTMAPNVVASFSLIQQPPGSGVTIDATNITGVDPLLKPLADNGGPTATMALRKKSPAVDKGSSDAAADQRGATRPFNQKGVKQAPGGDNADIGAYERVLCAGVLVNEVGTAGDDELEGTKRKDGILALGGKDSMKGKKGNDGLCGGAGRDKLRGGAGDDDLRGQGGKDLLVGGKGDDDLVGGKGKDTERE